MNETKTTNPVFVVPRADVDHCEITYHHDHTLVEIPQADLDQVAKAIREAAAPDYPNGDLSWRVLALAAIKAWIGEL